MVREIDFGTPSRINLWKIFDLSGHLLQPVICSIRSWRTKVNYPYHCVSNLNIPVFFVTRVTSKLLLAYSERLRILGIQMYAPPPS